MTDTSLVVKMHRNVMKNNPNGNLSVAHRASSKVGVPLLENKKFLTIVPRTSFKGPSHDYSIGELEHKPTTLFGHSHFTIFPPQLGGSSAHQSGMRGLSNEVA